MKKLFTSLVLLLCIFVNVSSICAADNPRGVSLQKEGNSYRVSFNLPEYKMTSISGGGENFTLLEIPEYGITSRVGLPQLPQITFSIMIAYGENTPVVKVITQEKSVTEMRSKIYPAQMPWEKVSSLDDRPFVIDRTYYNSKGSVDDPFVVVSEPFIIGGAKGVNITIYPFAYNPSENKLYVTNKGTFSLELQNEAAMRFAPQESFDKFFASLFLNYTSGKSTGTNNYLIITAPEFESGLASFTAHKQGLGYNVTVVNTTVTGTSNTAIKTYIQNLYNNVPTRPEFILLVGDVDKIPCWTGGGEGTPPTDWNYALLEGSDLWVDAFLGRFPVQTLTQLGNIINKTIYMETGINGLWKKNVFMASTDNHTVSEGSHNMVIDTFFIPNGFTVNTKLYSYYGATTSQVSQSLDSGKVFAIYSGHGSETSWADGPVFSQSNVNSLNNTIFPYVYSFACITGSYHMAGECFAETWIRSPKAGVTFWGASVNSYWDEDDILERRIVKALYTDNLKRNAENFVKGKIYLVQYFGSMTATMQRYIEMYNCMGDPSIYQLPYGPAILHTPLPNTENMTGPYTVNCAVAPSGSAITGTKLFWTRATAFDSLAMTNSSGNNWTANIPGNGSTATYKYYIRTQDAMNRVTYLPGGAPLNYFAFTASTDITKPVIVTTPLASVPKTTWPASVTAAVTDNIGVDSVWVKWYKNNTGTEIKQFKLLNTGGSVYTSAFNSDTTQIAVNDSVFYRVFARDISSAHNTDSTVLYKFKIINQVTATIGTGTTPSNFPFTTYWKDGRTQYLYLASELNLPSGYIAQMGFDVLTADPGAMNGFKISIQNTSMTTLSGFVTTGWNIAFAPTSYTVPGTGWQLITLASPFYYTAGSNLLIEVCYNNADYTQYSTVNSTSAPGMFWGRYADLTEPGDGCTATTWSSTTAPTGRANTRFVFNPGPTLAGNNNIESPSVYSLSQNYPNPFNPVTKINYSIPKQGLVMLKVFDILGREVKTLVNDIKTVGSYSVDFNGSELSSGVYFYRLQSAEFTDIKRMLLIK